MQDSPDAGRSFFNTLGIMLGHLPRPTSKGIPIKLPHSLRDRHMYIIGRSGSGKTNLIRLMALQDRSDGHGIGMLAPPTGRIPIPVLCGRQKCNGLITQNS
jgi:uncharacterized protein DUF87